MSPGFDAADALARGLAAHVQRWATTRGAPAGAAHAAASAAQALSLATGDGHVCVWLADLAGADGAFGAEGTGGRHDRPPRVARRRHRLAPAAAGQPRGRQPGCA
jgi:hypothetical protein